MNEINQAMKLIGGVEPTLQQVQRVQAIAHSLGFQPNDPMMPILIALDTYHGAFNALPAKAQASANECAAAAAQQSKQAIDRAIALAIQDFSPQVGAAINRVADEVAGRDKVKLIAAAVSISVLVLGLFGWLTHSTGYASGYDGGKVEAYAQAGKEADRAAWGNTAQGRLAFELAEAGSIENLARCTGEGWKLDRKKGNCVPQSYTRPDGRKYVKSWKVGKSAGGNVAHKVNVSWLEHLTGWWES